MKLNFTIFKNKTKKDTKIKKNEAKWNKNKTKMKQDFSIKQKLKKRKQKNFFL